MTTRIELSGNCKTNKAESKMSVNPCQHDIILFRWFIHTYYILDVLWCQPIKLIHVVSTSEFHEY